MHDLPSSFLVRTRVATKAPLQQCERAVNVSSTQRHLGERGGFIVFLPGERRGWTRRLHTTQYQASTGEEMLRDAVGAVTR